MSAIWGFISLEKDLGKLNKRVAECRELMAKPYEECAIDRFDEETFDNGFFSCGIQYFTQEAEYEKLPVRDEEKGIVFTGDIVLNARDELISELLREISEKEITRLEQVLFSQEASEIKEDMDKWPDGALCYAAYTLWDKAFVDHIQGLFAIAVYDINSGSFRLFTDHMGCRCVYYSVCGNELFFSSLCRPITDSMPSEYFGICEKFIAGAEYNNTPSMLLFPGLSPFENILQLTRGHYVEVTDLKGQFTAALTEYYNPAEKKEQRYKLTPPKENTDKYYRETFRKVFWQSVHDAMRCKGEVAATLSSGLDSTSVASVAATYLAKENRKLYGFTSIPLEDYENTLEAGYIPDESPGVLKFCENYPNIEPLFTGCEGKSAFTEMDRLISQFEVPGKALVNQVWMIDIANQMKAKGCTVMLNGQYGNFTLSNGNAFARTFQELYAGNFKEAKKQLAAFGRRYSIPRKVLFSSTMEMAVNKLLFITGLDGGFNSGFDKVYLKEELLRKYRIKATEKSTYKKRGYADCEPRYKQDNLIMDETISGTMGIFDTKISLFYGILFRDPTRDKRMVDLCIALPGCAFTEDGLERRLVRGYLDDMIPAAIRLDPGHRGVQSPDAALRLGRYGTEKKDTDIIPDLYKYMNEESVRNLLKQDVTEENHKDMVRILALDSFLKDFSGK